VAVLVLVLLVLLAGIWCKGAVVGIHLMEKQAVEHGVAGYDPVTGAWKWTVPESPSDR